MGRWSGGGGMEASSNTSTAHLLWRSFCDEKHTIERLTENGPESPTHGSEELQEPQWLADRTRQTENIINRKKKKNVTNGGAPVMAPGGGQSPNVVSLAGGGGARPRPCSLPTWGTNE